MRSFTVCLIATVCNVRVKMGEMDGHVARMGNKEHMYKILVEQHGTTRPSRNLRIVGVLRLKRVLMK